MTLRGLSTKAYSPASRLVFPAFVCVKRYVPSSAGLQPRAPASAPLRRHPHAVSRKVMADAVWYKDTRFREIWYPVASS